MATKKVIIKGVKPKKKKKVLVKKGTKGIDYMHTYGGYSNGPTPMPPA